MAPRPRRWVTLSNALQMPAVVVAEDDFARFDAGLHFQTVAVVIARPTAGLDARLNLEGTAVVIARPTGCLDAGLNFQSRVLAARLHVRLSFFFLPPEANPEIAAGVPGADDDEDGGFPRIRDRARMTSPGSRN